MSFRNGHALVIGVGSYSKLPQRWQAPITVEDARTLATTLQNPTSAGYPPEQVAFLHDAGATKTNVLRALDELAQKVGKDDTVFFFYSGHGHYGADNTYYLTTHDTEVEFAGSKEKVRAGAGISQADLLAKLRAIKANKVLLIFNACHSGELMPTLTPDEEMVLGDNLPDETGKALLGTGEGRVLISACRPKQYSFIGPDAITIFAQSLIAGLEGTGVTSRSGYISVYDLYAYLYDAVRLAVRKKIPEHVRNSYGGTQEPTLTIIQQVGPFPVALYKGQDATLAAFTAPPQPPTHTALTEVDEAEAKALFRQLVQPLSTGIHTTTAGRDVVQAGGDIVHRDKVGGDKITVSGISGSSVAIGRGASATNSLSSGGVELTQIFNQIYRRIDARPDNPDTPNGDVRAEMQKIEQETRKGEAANENRLLMAFRNLASMAEDIFDVTIAALTSPMAAVSTVVKKIAQKAKAEQSAK